MVVLGGATVAVAAAAAVAAVLLLSLEYIINRRPYIHSVRQQLLSHEDRTKSQTRVKHISQSTLKPILSPEAPSRKKSSFIIAWDEASIAGVAAFWMETSATQSTAGTACSKVCI